MKALFVTNMFPVESMNYYGIHVKEQIDCLTSHFAVDSDVFFINAKEGGKIEYLLSIYRLYLKIRQNRYDFIHIHYGLSGLFLLFFRPKVRIFLTFHGGDILVKQGHFIQVFLSKMIARKVDKVFILNKYMEDLMRSINVKYEVLPCGIDSDFFFNNGYKALKEDGSKLILFPGDPSRSEKNFTLFHDVIELLSKKKDYPINFCYIHNLTRIEVRNLLCRADCLLMTSLSEGSPQIIKEALACDLPVVSVPVGDVSETLKDVPSCFVSQDYDPISLAHLVLKIFDSTKPSIRDSFLSKDQYENKSVCKKLMKSYLSV